jgi:hypothetical protein
MVATGQVVTGGGGPHTHPWADITGEPATFPPDAHEHSIADVETLQAALDGKAPTHAHPYAATVHGHAVADVANLQDTVDAVAVKPTIYVWDSVGGAYVASAVADIYMGPVDPGLPDTLWIDTTP